MAGELQAFLTAVDELETHQDVIEGALTFFGSLKPPLAIHAWRSFAARHNTYTGKWYAVKAFCKRAVQVAASAGAAKRVKTTDMSPIALTPESPKGVVGPQGVHNETLNGWFYYAGWMGTGCRINAPKAQNKTTVLNPCIVRNFLFVSVQQSVEI